MRVGHLDETRSSRRQEGNSRQDIGDATNCNGWSLKARALLRCPFLLGHQRARLDIALWDASTLNTHPRELRNENVLK